MVLAKSGSLVRMMVRWVCCTYDVRGSVKEQLIRMV
jgi:hypothetical protein